ncbi:hypothetical protein M408DRAFT_122849 [Serendipita vermifera MAFF 305830]|uniref:Uncharacterized protein n=1 Tax=Serendipita vermifera MAFF 305830 TaxID=933852 RepID=A0A0C3ALA1_SERVB|nr:hypothetical protein M408DRAFT_122849 [Serendipita vermifera MAFF 305830]
MQIVKNSEGEDFDRAISQATIHQTFIDLCGDYPGAVNIRHSSKRFEELKGLDWEDLQPLDTNQAACDIEKRQVVSNLEQDVPVRSADTILAETVDITKESPTPIAEKGHAITPVKGYDLSEEGTDTVLAGTVPTTKKSSSTIPNESEPLIGASTGEAIKRHNACPILLAPSRGYAAF